MKELKVNEEFKNLIPPLTAEEKTELEKSLMLFGCRDKIVTREQILNGQISMEDIKKEQEGEN